MKVLVISSCTGAKASENKLAPTITDFEKGEAHIQQLHKKLVEMMLPAKDLYTGLQHVYLMNAIRYLQENHSSVEIDLHIVSAGYGLVNSNDSLPPYEVTFTGMKSQELKAWSSSLNIPEDFAKLVSKPYDLILLLLGNEYLAACQLNDGVRFNAPTIAFCGKAQLPKLQKFSNVTTVLLTNEDAKADKFSSALISIKGNITNRFLVKLHHDSEFAEKLSKFDGEELKQIMLEEKGVGLPEKKEAKPRTKSSSSAAKKASRPKAVANPEVDKVIPLSQEWKKESEEREIKYFIPEWDDLVDPDYDFDNDIHSGGTGNWTNETYAHQMYSKPNYDGLLISKVVAEKSKSKAKRINELGVHRFLRVPREVPIMGDCGAFGYIDQKNPPYTNDEILDYYTRLDFDYGVSIDHLIVPAFEQDQQHRYDLTIHNAELFLSEHKKRDLQWEPIGAVQGWDAKSYALAAKKYVNMGYKYIGLGSMVRTPTKKVLEILHEVHKYVPSNVKMHLFGLARYDALTEFKKLGVTSVDSASFLRRAWMGTGQNYLSPDAKWYAAIRIPQAEKSFRAKRMVSEGRATLEEVCEMEANCFEALKQYDSGNISAEETVAILHNYDQLVTPDRPDNRAEIYKTLKDAPWKKCGCDICKKDGIQVVIFRGNNRNRRRGFHNTHIFYDIFGKNLKGSNIKIGKSDTQLSLLDEQ
jgi:hypothetical protein